MKPVPPDEQSIRPPNDRKALEWITALAAAGVTYRLRQEGDQWHLTVPQALTDEAWDVIQDYEKVNQGWPPHRPAYRTGPARAHPLWAGLWGSGFIIMVFACFGPYNPGSPWLRAAAADSVGILDGQWWRVITALTLHSDFSHLAGNAVFLTLLGGFVCRNLGVGAAWFLILASGILGNLLTASMATSPHLAVGASTASFGALGLLCMDQALDAYRQTGHWQSLWSRVWIPLCAGLAMLGFLGVAPGSDIAAHGWGFLCGVALAGVAALPRFRRIGETGQALLSVSTVALIMFAWRTAIRFAS